MASATRFPIKSVAVTAALVVCIGAWRTNLRQLAIKTFTGPGSYSRIAAVAILLANLKSAPFAWHFRVFNSILKHCLFSIPNIPPELKPASIFLPVITSSHASLWECDYNMHKSNSTYFSDLDVTRSHLVCCLLQPAIHKLHNNARERLVLDKAGRPVKSGFSIALGSVMCSFKREIGIYEGYEMWSRLLCWDRKWLYVVTHFVKKGTVRPAAYVLADGSWFGGNGYTKMKGMKRAAALAEGEVDVDEKAIFASAITKYVVKLGRLTVHPEVVLQASGLLPPKPGGWVSMSESSGETTPEARVVRIEDETVNDAVNGAVNGVMHSLVEKVIKKKEAVNNGVAAEAAAEAVGEREWDWKRVEAKNERGMKWVDHFATLDGISKEFTGSKEPALGRYRDFLI